MSDTVKTPCPLGKRVLLVKDDAPETSEGGIVLPSDSQEKPLTARVIAIGSGITPVGPILEVGDEVIYASFAGTTFNIGGKEIIVVDEEDIMLVLREVPNA
jgi:chaperonin GroES